MLQAPDSAKSLQSATAALGALGVVPAISTQLAEQREAMAQTLRERILGEVEAFSSSANPDLLPELVSHVNALTMSLCSILGRTTEPDLTFVCEHARRRAQQRFPLEALLHAYRCSHRIILDWIRDAALTVADPAVQVRRVVATVADFALEFTDAVSTVATAEYVRHTRALAEVEGDRRTQLLNTLLSGYDESDGRAAQLLKRAGYLEQRQSFCVAVARSVDPREMQSTARAERMLEAVAQVLREAPVRSLVGMREGLVTVVVAGTRRLSGWTAPQVLLADRIQPCLDQVGPAALIGVSNDAPSTSHVRRAHREAQIALNFASVSARVMRYSNIPFRQMLIRQACEQQAPALPEWLVHFAKANQKSRGALLDTLNAYADTNMNALQTAKRLSVHANTVYARMQRIAEITGKNALGYHELTELLLVIDCHSQLPQS